MLARMENYARVPFAPVWCLHTGTDGVLRPVPFAPVWCLHAGTDGVLRPRVPFAPRLVPPYWHGWSITPVCHLRPSGASMLARMEYYAPVPFAPVWCLYAGTDGVLRPCAICARLVPLCWHGWSITPPCHLRPSGASMLARMEYYAPVPFAPVWCLHAGTDGILRPVPFASVLVPLCWHGWSITPRAICVRPGASMLARMEYYARVPFAPVLVPPCWHGWNITPVCHLRPFWCLHAGTDGILRPVPFASVLVPPLHHIICIMVYLRY